MSWWLNSSSLWVGCQDDRESFPDSLQSDRAGASQLCNLYESKVDLPESNDKPHVTANGNITVYLQARVAMNRVRYDICGSGSKMSTSTVDAVGELGFDFELLDHETQLVGSKPNAPNSTQASSK